MCYLIPRNSTDTGEAIYDWSAALKNSYPDFDIIQTTFASAFSLFPIIRAIERRTRQGSVTLDDTRALFSAIVTDRGILAEQTRDASMFDNQSRVVTQLGYAPKHKPTVAHEKGVLKSLESARPLWQGYFQNRNGYDRFADLLNAFYQQCRDARKTVDKFVKFPNDDDDNGDVGYADTLSLRNNEIYPDDWEIAFTQQTKILLPYKNEVPAIDYFSELALRSGIGAFSNEELTLFIQKILPVYRNYIVTDRSASSGKKYEAKITSLGTRKLQKQTEDFGDLYVYLLTAQPVSRPIHSLSSYNLPELNRCSQLAKLFHKHDSVCSSCRSRSKSEEAITNFCEAFASQIVSNWAALRGNPFLVFRLWSTDAQSRFARGATVSWSRLLNEMCNSRQTWADLAVKEADQDLYDGLLSVCFPEGVSDSVRNAYCKLMEDDGRSGVPIRHLCDRKVAAHINECLPFRPVDLYTIYRVGIINPDDLISWLAQAPPVLDILSRQLDRLPHNQYRELERLFQGLMEKPAKYVENYHAHMDIVMSSIDYQELTAQFPKLNSKCEEYQNTFCRFLIAWILLQRLCSGAKDLLREIYSRLFGDIDR